MADLGNRVVNFKVDFGNSAQSADQVKTSLNKFTDAMKTAGIAITKLVTVVGTLGLAYIGVNKILKTESWSLFTKAIKDSMIAMQAAVKGTTSFSTAFTVMGTSVMTATKQISTNMIAGFNTLTTLLQTKAKAFGKMFEVVYHDLMKVQHGAETLAGPLGKLAIGSTELSAVLGILGLAILPVSKLLGGLAIAAATASGAFAAAITAMMYGAASLVSYVGRKLGELSGAWGQVGLDFEEQQYGLEVAVRAFQKATNDYSISAEDLINKIRSISAETGIAAAEIKQGVNVMFEMSRVTKLTGTQIDTLVKSMADFAIVRGVSFFDVVYAIDQSFRGWQRSASALGLTLDEASVSAMAAQHNWSLIEKQGDQSAQTFLRYKTVVEQLSLAHDAGAESARKFAFGALRQLRGEWNTLFGTLGLGVTDVWQPLYRLLAETIKLIREGLGPEVLKLIGTFVETTSNILKVIAVIAKLTIAIVVLTSVLRLARVAWTLFTIAGAGSSAILTNLAALFISLGTKIPLVGKYLSQLSVWLTAAAASGASLATVFGLVLRVALSLTILSIKAFLIAMAPVLAILTLLAGIGIGVVKAFSMVREESKSSEKSVKILTNLYKELGDEAERAAEKARKGAISTAMSWAGALFRPLAVSTQITGLAITQAGLQDRKSDLLWKEAEKEIQKENRGKTPSQLLTKIIQRRREINQRSYEQKSLEHQAIDDAMQGITNVQARVRLSNPWVSEKEAITGNIAVDIQDQQLAERSARREIARKNVAPELGGEELNSLKALTEVKQQELATERDFLMLVGREHEARAITIRLAIEEARAKAALVSGAVFGDKEVEMLHERLTLLSNISKYETQYRYSRFMYERGDTKKRIDYNQYEAIALEQIRTAERINLQKKYGNDTIRIDAEMAISDKKREQTRLQTLASTLEQMGEKEKAFVEQQKVLQINLLLETKLTGDEIKTILARNAEFFKADTDKLMRDSILSRLSAETEFKSKVLEIRGDVLESIKINEALQLATVKNNLESQLVEIKKSGINAVEMEKRKTNAIKVAEEQNKQIRLDALEKTQAFAIRSVNTMLQAYKGLSSATTSISANILQAQGKGIGAADVGRTGALEQTELGLRSQRIQLAEQKGVPAELKQQQIKAAEMQAMASRIKIQKEYYDTIKQLEQQRYENIKQSLTNIISAEHNATQAMLAYEYKAFESRVLAIEKERQDVETELQTRIAAIRDMAIEAVDKEKLILDAQQEASANRRKVVIDEMSLRRDATKAAIDYAIQEEERLRSKIQSSASAYKELLGLINKPTRQQKGDVLLGMEQSQKIQATYQQAMLNAPDAESRKNVKEAAEQAITDQAKKFTGPAREAIEKTKLLSVDKMREKQQYEDEEFNARKRDAERGGQRIAEPRGARGARAEINSATKTLVENMAIYKAELSLLATQTAALNVATLPLLQAVNALEEAFYAATARVNEFSGGTTEPGVPKKPTAIENTSPNFQLRKLDDKGREQLIIERDIIDSGSKSRVEQVGSSSFKDNSANTKKNLRNYVSAPISSDYASRDDRIRDDRLVEEAEIKQNITYAGLMNVRNKDVGAINGPPPLQGFLEGKSNLDISKEINAQAKGTSNFGFDISKIPPARELNPAQNLPTAMSVPQMNLENFGAAFKTAFERMQIQFDESVVEMVSKMDDQSAPIRDKVVGIAMDRMPAELISQNRRSGVQGP